jgi:adenine-specific DNA methylase
MQGKAGCDDEDSPSLASDGVASSRPNALFLSEAGFPAVFYNGVPMDLKDQRLIERGFPCHQVGAETQRERGASSALPPLYFLHVWWARRPLTPSRAAIVASLSPRDTDPEVFLRQLGIERVQAIVNGVPWTLSPDLIRRLADNRNARESLPVDAFVLRALQAEAYNRQQNRALIAGIVEEHPRLLNDPVLKQWDEECVPIPEPWPEDGEYLPVRRVMGDPAWFKSLLSIGTRTGIRVPNLYGYERAFSSAPPYSSKRMTVLDPTAGGGSIPFEALRLGHTVIANELNPVAATILHATLDYPFRFGKGLENDFMKWGKRLLSLLDEELSPFFPTRSPLPIEEANALRQRLRTCPEIIPLYDHEDVTTYLYARQVTCPSCGGEAPLLNTCWLSKEAGDTWGVQIVPDGKPKGGKVAFRTYRVSKGRGPNGEDPNVATVTRGVGQCVHCRQAITGDEIKAQARGESPHGPWRDRLYCVVAVRLQPKLDKHGQPLRYQTGERTGEIKTEKIRFFRPPNERDLKALKLAEDRLKAKWDEWEAAGLIPTEKVPEGNDMRPVIYGMPRWCDLFTPRQLLGHLTLIEGLNKLKPEILAELGPERGRAVVTYLQFAIDKGLDYNSRQTRWEYTRGIVKGTFGRHDFSLKWTFGEMIFTGPASGAAWGLSQIVDAYQGIAELAAPVHDRWRGETSIPVTILNQTAAYMPQIDDSSVDLICMDPPYYNNVQYAELSDYFYVWQKRTLNDLHPEIFHSRLTNKTEEAVANPVRDGTAVKAKKAYERMMEEIFSECRRVLKDDGLLTLMFTHKQQEAWETLTRSLVEAGWTITASFPVESESAASLHQRDMAAAASSIFITCRKRDTRSNGPTFWTGLGGRGVQSQITDAVKAALKEFEPLKLNPVDEMVASYGRALHVLSQNWPVMDGDEPVGPLRAMLEASRVVAENQVNRITGGRIAVSDLDTETGMALTLFGIYGLSQFPYDEALSLSRSLNIALNQEGSGGYRVKERGIGINDEAEGGSRRARSSETQSPGYPAPLVRSGSKLRLARPDERDQRRLESPQTDWDILHGVIMAYHCGEAPVARAYLQKHAAQTTQRILDLLDVWAAEVSEETLRKEAETMRFDLNPRSGKV